MAGKRVAFYDPAEAQARKAAETSRDEGDDMSQVLLWTFFFYGEDLAGLESFGRQFLTHGYDHVLIMKDEGAEDAFADEDEDDMEEGDEPSHVLALVRAEAHSINSLMAREDYLEALADEAGILFDHHDVGPTEGPNVLMPDGDPLV